MYQTNPHFLPDLNSTLLTCWPTAPPLSQAPTKPWPQHLSSSEQLYQWEVFSHFRSTFLMPIRARSRWEISMVWRALQPLCSVSQHKELLCCVVMEAVYMEMHFTQPGTTRIVLLLIQGQWWVYLGDDWCKSLISITCLQPTSSLQLLYFVDVGKMCHSKQPIFIIKLNYLKGPCLKESCENKDLHDGVFLFLLTKVFDTIPKSFYLCLASWKAYTRACT